MALRLALSDAVLHKHLCPVDAVARMVFELLEQIRVEAMAPVDMPGLVRNLRHRHEQWALAYHQSGLTETAKGILIYTVAQVCRARVTAQPVVDATESVIETTRMALAPLLGHDLAGLRRHRADQAAYAQHALAIAHAVAQAIHEARATDEDNEASDLDGEKDERKLFGLWMDFEGEPDDGVTAASSGRSRVLEEADDGYCVFTTAYDVEVRAATLVRAALLKEYRARLDRRIAAQGLNVARLVRQIKTVLAVDSRNEWEGSQEEGSIDGRRLSQLVASPTERRLFRIERQEPATDCVVSFLIDCSGSMRQHVETVAMLVDVFARALEQAGVSSEVLGFTTGAWNGGRALRDWQRARRPAHPGRLNEACHMVFKDAGTPWRRARPEIAALLKSDLFREGIDGEAVDWACARWQGRSEGRRLLIVISDGSPMDSATHLANDAHYLDHHLVEVVTRHEKQGDTEIYGVGVGLDLSPYYRRSLVIDTAAALRNEVFSEIVAMIARR